MHKFTGLTTEEVKKKRSAGQSNEQNLKPGKTIGTIIRENTFTLFNLLNFLLAACLFAVKAYSNMFFIVIIMMNITIGIVQEIRAKKMVERLTLLAQSDITVLRDGSKQKIAPNQLVLGDYVQLKSGEQIPSDMKVLDGKAEVNESLLTGESDTILKKIDDTLLSGSFLTSGQVLAEVEHVGADNYAAKIINETKSTKPLKSELIGSIRKISTFTSFIILPIGILLFIEAFFLKHSATSTAVVASVAALLGMLPKGLVLLISIALTTGVLKLAKKQVLVQNMYAIENLAHMDVLCLDKTGTLTEGKMQVEELHYLKDAYKNSLPDLMKNYLFATDDNNPTAQALKQFFGQGQTKSAVQVLPFSSERKYGAVTFEDCQTLYLGSPENLLATNQIPEVIQQYQTSGLRILLIAFSPAAIQDTPLDLLPVAFITLSDPIRANAKETLDFLETQAVDLKIISGDNPKTVAAIAEKAGFKNYQTAIDLSDYTDENEIRQLAHSHSIFGRVTPQQKKLLIHELKQQNQTVGMTGDGVNDILALREADISIAMAEGDDATRQIADIVLLDSDFGKLPAIIFEGRRVVNNITRSSGVFFIKTIYSLLVSLFCILTVSTFPFIPLQITLIDLAIEGYPAFFLSFEKDNQKIAGRFLPTAIKRALPSGLLVMANILLVWLFEKLFLSPPDARTLMYYLLIGISCFAVMKSCQPFNRLRLFLTISTTVGSYVAIILFHQLLSVGTLSLMTFGLFIIFMLGNLLLWNPLAKQIQKLNLTFLQI
ncbi:HAD-IC family P-type ATPase [Enterococcus hermanniensis]|uniref:HAD ATPase, P-type, family IC n=1 Tax=Enterococcus hermanniensis TaxID=249189 RepID=A0A1L8TPH6_9ENTE|nr:HAD-IC family P-type ATPase [Enterococcus hermanniensis]OJG46180.1 HAD ATPase, P-type, family IC [Enterococcus hermanniensis]